jgi:DNA-binding LacI/PurR family transcriptional regulator
VPEDVALIGYDNVPVGAQTEPPLDTVDPHTGVQIRHALDMLGAPPEPGRVPIVVVTPTLLCRASCAQTHPEGG